MGQITPAVAKFDFQGQLLENGKQVITDVYKNINITIPGVTATASGQLEIITTPALDSESTEASFHAKHLKMTLTLPPGPEGPQGDIGPTPRITAVAQGGTTASVSAVHLSNDPNYDYQLKFVLPQGPQGLKAPAIIPKVHTKTAGVVDITVTSTGSGNNKTEFWDFGLPVANITVGSVTALAAGTSPTVTASPFSNNNQVNLNFGIPSGKPGAAAEIEAVTVSATASISPATVTTSSTIDSETGGQKVTMHFDIPKGDTPTITTANEYQSGTKIGTKVTFTFPTDPENETSFIVKDGTLDSNLNSDRITWTTSIDPNTQEEKGKVPSDYINWRENEQDVPVEQIDGTLPIEQGGTGATTATAALINLGVLDAIDDSINASISAPTGVVINQIDASISASVAPSGIVTDKINSMIAAAVTPSGAITNQINTAIEDVIYIGTTTPTTNNTKIWIRTY